MDEWSVRAAGPSDRESVLALATTALRDASFGAALTAQFGALAGLEPEPLIHAGIAARWNDGATFFVAETEGRVIGFVIAECQERGVGWIPVLAVADSHRRRGVGRALLTHALSHLKSQGMRYARIETLATNTASQALFAECGFVEFAREVQFFREV